MSNGKATFPTFNGEAGNQLNHADHHRPPTIEFQTNNQTSLRQGRQPYNSQLQRDRQIFERRKKHFQKKGKSGTSSMNYTEFENSIRRTIIMSRGMRVADNTLILNFENVDPEKCIKQGYWFHDTADMDGQDLSCLKKGLTPNIHQQQLSSKNIPVPKITFANTQSRKSSAKKSAQNIENFNNSSIPNSRSQNFFSEISSKMEDSIDNNYLAPMYPMFDKESKINSSFVSNIANLVQGKFIDILVNEKGSSRRITRPEEMVDYSATIEKRLKQIVRKSTNLREKNHQNMENDRKQSQLDHENIQEQLQLNNGNTLGVPQRHKGRALTDYSNFNKIQEIRNKRKLTFNMENENFDPIEGIKQLHMQVRQYSNLNNHKFLEENENDLMTAKSESPGQDIPQKYLFPDNSKGFKSYEEALATGTSTKIPFNFSTRSIAVCGQLPQMPKIFIAKNTMTKVKLNSMHGSPVLAPATKPKKQII